MLIERIRQCTVGLLALGLAFGAGILAQAQDNNEVDGRIIQIGPADEGETPVEPLDGESTSEQQPEQSAYWIGLLGGPVTPELLHQIDLPDDQGILVRDVLPEGPAAKAGLETYDILLAANGHSLSNMSELVDLVREAGDSQTEIQLDVLRKGRAQSISISPEERPERFSAAAPRRPGEWGQGFMGQPDGMGHWFGQQFSQNGSPRFQFRAFGPGVGDQQLNMRQIPIGVSVTVQKEGDGPAHITVKRGDEVWEVDADKPEDLDALPEDLRPLVEQMMETGPEGGMHGMRMPGMEQMLPPGMEPELRQRVEEMERQMHQLQEQLLGPSDQDEAQ